jgi:type II secretion system protein N
MKVDWTRWRALLVKLEGTRWRALVAKLDWFRWRPQLPYAAFALVAFALSLRWTFPSEAMKERVIMEAGRHGWQVDVERVSAGGGLLGVRARGIRLETATGVGIPIDDLTASLRLLPLLIGRRSVAFDAVLYEGRVEGTADLSGDARRVVLDVSGVDLARALPLRKASGLELLGTLSAKADVTLPAAADQRPTGSVDVAVAGAGIGGGEVPIPGMGSSLTVPGMSLGELVAAVKLADGKATFEKLETTGGEADLRAEGLYFILQPRIEYSPIFGKAKVKVSDAFWTRSDTQSFKGLAEVTLAQAKGADGAWTFSVSGSVGRPKMQPAP